MPPRLGLLVAILLWSVSFVAIKHAVGEISPVAVVFSRFAIGAALLLLVARRLPPRESWRDLALMGFLGVFLHQLLQSYALTLTSAANAGWLVAMTPIWSAILSAAVLRERLDVWKLAGIVGGFAGAFLVVSRGELASLASLPSTRGDILIMIGSINWAVYSVVGHRTIRSIGPTLATAWSMTAGVAMLAPLFVATRGWTELPKLTGTGWLAVVFLGVGCSGAAYLLWYRALERVELSRVAVRLYLEPPLAFLAAVVLLGERVTMMTIVGGIVVVLSVAVAQKPPSAFFRRSAAIPPAD